MIRLTVQQYRQVCSTLLQAVGVTSADIAILTDVLLYASLRGHDSHGLGHFPQYIRGYQGQRGTFAGVQKGAQPVVRTETPSTVVIDANWSMGHKAALTATEMVIRKAKTAGIAAATIYNSTHTGALGYYVSRIVENDMIGIMFSASTVSSPPWGGTERSLGINPIAMGFPAKNEYPILIDMATSATTWAVLNQMMRSDQPMPIGLMLDENGGPTTEPKALGAFGSAQGQGPRGSIANMGGGHKGYSIQLATDILGGVLPALVTSDAIATSAAKFHNPSLIIAINISFFQDIEGFKEKMDARIKQLKNSRKKPEVAEIFMPGEQGFKRREKYLKEGIPVSSHYWGELRKLAEELKVQLPNVVDTPG